MSILIKRKGGSAIEKVGRCTNCPIIANKTVRQGNKKKGFQYTQKVKKINNKRSEK